MYDMPLRDYDPASAKWFNIDPVTHYDQSPFMAMNGNPVTFSDPSGANGEQINTWHYAGSGSMNSFLNGGAGNLGYGDHMLGGSRNSFWMNNGSSLSGSGANPFSQSYSNLTINLNWNNLNLNTNINFTKNGIHVSSDNEVFLPGVLLPTVDILRGNKHNGAIIQQHVYVNSPYHHAMRDYISNMGKAYQNAGDSLQGMGYGLTMTGVGAPIGIPLALIGNAFSLGGTLLNIGTSFHSQGIGSIDAWKSIGFEGLGYLGGKYLKKIENQLTPLEKEIHEQSLNMHLIIYERIFN